MVSSPISSDRSVEQAKDDSSYGSNADDLELGNVEELCQQASSTVRKFVKSSNISHCDV